MSVTFNTEGRGETALPMGTPSPSLLQMQSWGEAEEPMPKISDRAYIEAGDAPTARKGIGSYAAKLEEGRRQGNSPAEVSNYLCLLLPVTAATLLCLGSSHFPRGNPTIVLGNY